MERRHGAVLPAPATRIGVPPLELRQVVNGSGLVEHRYIPTLTVATSLVPRLAMRNRIRAELRDIAGTWSQRYQERVTLMETLAVRRQVLQPYGHLARGAALTTRPHTHGDGATRNVHGHGNKMKAGERLALTQEQRVAGGSRACDLLAEAEIAYDSSDRRTDY